MGPNASSEPFFVVKFVKVVEVAQNHSDSQVQSADVIPEEWFMHRFSYREPIDMSTRRLFCGGFLAALVLAPSFVFGQTDGIRWRGSLDAAKVEASQTGRLVLLHFWSPNCGPCRKLEGEVFPLPQVGAAIEKNYVPVKINAVASSAMAYAFKVDRVPSDVILTPHGNILATYVSPLTPQGYLEKLDAVVTQFGQKGSKPAETAGPRQVNAAYAGLQGSQTPVASTPVGSPMASAPASNATPATSVLATAALNRQPASQPSQSVDRYALPAHQNSSPRKSEVPVNAMPSSYRNPYMAPQMQSSAVVQAEPPTAYPSQRPATTNTVPSAVGSNAVRGAVTATMAKANLPKTSSVGSQLPAGSPPLGFDGYCPVTLKNVKKWERGDVQYGAIHRGRTYLFVGNEQRQQFLANPDAYSPVFSGMDPVALLDNKQTVEGIRKYGFEYRGAFYLFSSQETMQKFASQPDRYAAGVRQAMIQHDGSSGVIRR